MILCERCGNEFNRGKLVRKYDKEYIECPYCQYRNRKLYRKKKKKAGIQNEQYS